MKYLVSLHVNIVYMSYIKILSITKLINQHIEINLSLFLEKILCGLDIRDSHKNVV